MTEAPPLSGLAMQEHRWFVLKLARDMALMAPYSGSYYDESGDTRQECPAHGPPGVGDVIMQVPVFWKPKSNKKKRGKSDSSLLLRL